MDVGLSDVGEKEVFVARDTLETAQIGNQATLIVTIGYQSYFARDTLEAAQIGNQVILIVTKHRLPVICG